MKFWKIALSIFLAVTLLGCSSKYKTPDDIQTLVPNVTKKQIRSGILLSDVVPGKISFLGAWKMEEIDSSTIKAELFNRGHKVIVLIAYSEKGYTIKYESVSNNLKDKKGNIHRNYNRWVHKLDLRIQKNIFATKYHIE